MMNSDTFDRCVEVLRKVHENIKNGRPMNMTLSAPPLIIRGGLTNIPYVLTTEDLDIYLGYMKTIMDEDEYDILIEKLNTEIAPMKCPVKGDFYGYKACRMWNNTNKYCIVKLLIPEDAYRSSAFGNKCRCNKAKVIDIYNPKTGRHLNKARSFFINNFIYKKGEIVESEIFDLNRFNACGSGIHFFMTEDEAIVFGRFYTEGKVI